MLSYLIFYSFILYYFLLFLPQLLCNEFEIVNITEANDSVHTNTYIEQQEKKYLIERNQTE